MDDAGGTIDDDWDEDWDSDEDSSTVAGSTVMGSATGSRSQSTMGPPRTLETRDGNSVDLRARSTSGKYI